MSDATFEQLWRRILVYAPECPVPLAQEFVNTAYSRAVAYYPWSQLKVESEFRIPDAYSTGTAQVTEASASVIGNATTWTSAMVNRQFMTEGIAPIYTIASFTDATHITLDRPYEKATNSAVAYNISVVYVEVPTDFLTFDVVRDLTNNWKLRTNFTQGQLDVWDAKRNFAGTTWIVASAPPRVVTGAAPVVRYEMWPRPLPAAKTYTYRYIKRPPLMSAASDRPFFPLRGDYLRKGAMAELALWPGTSTLKNMFYNLDQHRTLEAEFQAGLGDAWREDNEISQTAVKYDISDEWQYAPIDAAFWQSHDVGF
jgi:hypothetical protein